MKNEVIIETLAKKIKDLEQAIGGFDSPIKSKVSSDVMIQYESIQNEIEYIKDTLFSTSNNIHKSAKTFRSGSEKVWHMAEQLSQFLNKGYRFEEFREDVKSFHDNVNDSMSRLDDQWQKQVNERDIKYKRLKKISIALVTMSFFLTIIVGGVVKNKYSSIESQKVDLQTKTISRLKNDMIYFRYLIYNKSNVNNDYERFKINEIYRNEVIDNVSREDSVRRRRYELLPTAK